MRKPARWARLERLLKHPLYRLATGTLPFGSFVLALSSFCLTVWVSLPIQEKYGGFVYGGLTPVRELGYVDTTTSYGGPDYGRITPAGDFGSSYYSPIRKR